MALTTLRRMAEGGIFDQLGGGFARYSVDADWVVPHFEKMLYDNAQLLGTYAEAWARYRLPLAITETHLGCSREEMLLHEKDAQGLCAYVGTYCSSSFLGVCLTKRKVYCCFESKLSRILQEQGRPQIGKTWGTPKKPLCDGFTIFEFQQLDLSVMDFSEIYAEFVDAAKLPDEAATLIEIQAKIEAYYAAHKP